MEQNLTQGNLLHNMIRFSIPYLVSCFLQTFYGLADLFIVGRYEGAEAIAAVSIGSQIVHMVTVVIIGLVMGTTVSLSWAVGSGDELQKQRITGNTILLFMSLSVVLAAGLLLGLDGIVSILSTPKEAVFLTRKYMLICFVGIPCITAYNIIAGIFRGLGDSRSPMIYVGIAGIINIVLDFLLIGSFGMSAGGAAVATVAAQLISVLLAAVSIYKKELVPISLKGLSFSRESVLTILKIGIPIACQDGVIQVGFIFITIIANQRGLIPAAGVGIVEKLITFLFLVPSAMLATVSAVGAQNAGAGLHRQGENVLRYGLLICIAYGAVVSIVCELWAVPIVGLFATGEAMVAVVGAQYLRSYVVDTMFASIHFNFSGYFSAYGRSWISFVHNLLSILLFRVPGAYLAFVLFPDNLFPMGLAAPAGSIFSDIFCLFVYVKFHKRWFEGDLYER